MKSLAKRVVTPSRNIQIVGNRNWPPSYFVTDSGGTYLLKQIARVTVSQLYLTFPNWIIGSSYNGSGDQDGSSTYTINECWVEANSTTYPVLFSGSSSVAVPAGGNSVGVCALPLTAGSTFITRSYVTPGSSGKYPALAIGAKDNPGDGSLKGSNIAHQTGSSGLNSLTDVFGPCMITGLVESGNSPAVMIIGDSGAAGIGDSFSGSTTNSGFLPRALTGNRPWALYALSGESCSPGWLTVATRRSPLTGPYAKYFISEYGGNDLQDGATLAQLKSRMIQVWTEALVRNPSIKIFQTTLAPKTSTTDGWATTGNQTADFTANANRPTLNDWIRAGAPMVSGAGVAPGTGGAIVAGQAGHPLTDYFEVADTVESSRNSGLWKAPGYTADGIHPTPTGHIAAATAIDLTKLS